MATIQCDGRTVDYTEAGSGPPVMMLHAGGSSGRQWRKVVEALGDGYRVILPNLIGFGETDVWQGPGELTHDDQAAVARGLIERLCDGPVDVVGHSYGGATATRLVLGTPGLVRRLVLIEPIVTPLLPQAGEDVLFADYRRFGEQFIEFAEAGDDAAAWQSFLDHRNGPGTWAGMSEKAQNRFVSTTMNTAHGFRSNLNNPTTLADCRSIAAPTMMISGENTTAPERRVAE
ncbi:MAG: alpha/beta hydrolase, partial [Alphaproteobacteria bacterium]|nr:alpha/beta hydrolase [Alphaproteobacteria bacterium]